MDSANDEHSAFRRAMAGVTPLKRRQGQPLGSGRPVLKGAVHEWLARCNDVAAFASASPRHGGSGAVYVLLRRG